MLNLVSSWTNCYPSRPASCACPNPQINHFQQIREASGLPYGQMLFFDNERWNVTECSRLGITSIYTPKGMTMDAWREGLARWAEAPVGANASPGRRPGKRG